MMEAAAAEEEDGYEEFTTSTEALVEEEEETMHPRDWRQRRSRQRRNDRPKESTIKMEAAVEEDGPE